MDDIHTDPPQTWLTAEEAQAFAEALKRPAEVNERLRVALDRPVAVEWLDDSDV